MSIVHSFSKYMTAPVEKKATKVIYEDGGVSISNPKPMIPKRFYFGLARKGHLLGKPRYQSSFSHKTKIMKIFLKPCTPSQN